MSITGFFCALVKPPPPPSEATAVETNDLLVELSDDDNDAFSDDFTADEEQDSAVGSAQRKRPRRNAARAASRKRARKDDDAGSDDGDDDDDGGDDEDEENKDERAVSARFAMHDTAMIPFVPFTRATCLKTKLNVLYGVTLVRVCPITDEQLFEELCELVSEPTAQQTRTFNATVTTEVFKKSKRDDHHYCLPTKADALLDALQITNPEHRRNLLRQARQKAARFEHKRSCRQMAVFCAVYSDPLRFEDLQSPLLCYPIIVRLREDCIGAGEWLDCVRCPTEKFVKTSKGALAAVLTHSEIKRRTFVSSGGLNTQRCTAGLCIDANIVMRLGACAHGEFVERRAVPIFCDNSLREIAKIVPTEAYVQNSREINVRTASRVLLRRTLHGVQESPTELELQEILKYSTPRPPPCHQLISRNGTHDSAAAVRAWFSFSVPRTSKIQKKAIAALLQPCHSDHQHIRFERAVSAALGPQTELRVSTIQQLNTLILPAMFDSVEWKLAKLLSVRNLHDFIGRQDIIAAYTGPRSPIDLVLDSQFAHLKPLDNRYLFFQMMWQRVFDDPSCCGDAGDLIKFCFDAACELQAFARRVECLARSEHENGDPQDRCVVLPSLSPLIEQMMWPNFPQARLAAWRGNGRVVISPWLNYACERFVCTALRAALISDDTRNIHLVRSDSKLFIFNKTRELVERHQRVLTVVDEEENWQMWQLNEHSLVVPIHIVPGVDVCRTKVRKFFADASAALCTDVVLNVPCAESFGYEKWAMLLGMLCDENVLNVPDMGSANNTAVKTSIVKQIKRSVEMNDIAFGLSRRFSMIVLGGLAMTVNTKDTRGASGGHLVDDLYFGTPNVTSVQQFGELERFVRDSERIRYVFDDVRTTIRDAHQEEINERAERDMPSLMLLCSQKIGVPIWQFSIYELQETARVMGGTVYAHIPDAEKTLLNSLSNVAAVLKNPRIMEQRIVWAFDSVPSDRCLKPQEWLQIVFEGRKPLFDYLFIDDADADDGVAAALGVFDEYQKERPRALAGLRPGVLLALMHSATPLINVCASKNESWKMREVANQVPPAFARWPIFNRENASVWHQNYEQTIKSSLCWMAESIFQ